MFTPAKVLQLISGIMAPKTHTVGDRQASIDGQAFHGLFRAGEFNSMVEYFISAEKPTQSYSENIESQHCS